MGLPDDVPLPEPLTKVQLANEVLVPNPEWSLLKKQPL